MEGVLEFTLKEPKGVTEQARRTARGRGVESAIEAALITAPSASFITVPAGGCGSFSRLIKMMRKLIGLFSVVACLAPAAAARQKGRDKSQVSAREAEAVQRKAEEAQRRAQAVEILKGVVEGAAEIRETRTRVAVLSDALDLLWKHDEAHARANFVKAADGLSERFASDETKRQERSEIRAALAVLLKAFARHDPQGASRLLDKFQKLLEDVLKGNSVSPGERLSLAQAGLESDTAQSAALAAKVLEAGVPGSFPAYLNELERRDAAAAATLFHTALSILAGGLVYNPAQVTVLSAYAFRESEMSVPMASGGSGGTPLEFGMFASPLSPPSRDVNRPLTQAYLAAAGSYLNAEAVGLEQRGDPDAIHVGLCYFLVKKLRGYAERMGLGQPQAWAVLDAKYTALAERAKLSDSALTGLAATAQRLVTENTVFWFDAGDSAFAAAEKADDPVERAGLLATGVRWLIDEGKFTEAGQRLADIRDEKFRDQLNEYLYFRAAESSLKKFDWYGFNAQVNRVADARLRTYLLLSAARAAGNARKKEVSYEFLLAGLASTTKIEDPDAKAAALVTTAGIIYAADATWGAQVLAEGVNAINRTDHYDGELYGVTIEAPKYKLWLPLPDSDLAHCFEQAAKRDWPGSLAAAQGLNSKELQSQAYIAACRSIL